ncbi:uncharacterized protein LOC124301200 isoform X2 [Neodiprion virginianus]|uniref:uncharacterized protein LOC124301200 isoform X2 n=1 Tax=Neodiprion virginianus TaxID=2961670 RepID=UPI001EE74706|nr:uncharacterized protein LOC124301200 isoform X2 [Neodiprion virginianus]
MASAGEGVDFSDCCQVIYYLSHNGSKRTDEICKIAACTEQGQFSRYIMPSNGIPKRKTNFTRLKITNGELEENGRIVTTFPKRTAFTDFLEFLDDQRRLRRVILVTHNTQEFHGPSILRLVTDLGMMEEFQLRVAGFASTLSLFKEVFPRGTPCSLKAIAGNIPEFNWEAQAAYNATCREQILLEIIRYYRNRFQIENQIKNLTVSVRAALEKLETSDRKDSLKRVSGLSIQMRIKIAEARIGYENLVEAYQFGRNIGVLRLLRNVGIKQHVKNTILEHLEVSVPQTPQPIE